MPLTLYDCFITSTNLVPAAVLLQPWPFWNASTLLTPNLDQLYKCACENIKVGVAAKL